MTDRWEALREAAQRAYKAGSVWGLPDDTGWIEDLGDEAWAHIAAASPQAALDLLDRLDAMRKSCSHPEWNTETGCTVCGGRPRDLHAWAPGWQRDHLNALKEERDQALYDAACQEASLAEQLADAEAERDEARKLAARWERVARTYRKRWQETRHREEGRMDAWLDESERVAELMRERDALRARLEAERENVLGLQAERDEARKQAEGLMEAYQEERATTRRLRKSLAEAEAERDEARAEAASLRAEVERLSKWDKRQENMVAKLGSLSMDLERERDEARAEAAVLREQLSQSRAEVERLLEHDCYGCWECQPCHHCGAKPGVECHCG